MLSSYADCPRRAAAKQFRKLFAADGYEFRQLAPSVGSAAGTALHVITGEMNRAVWNGEQFRLDDALQMAFQGFSEGIAEGCEWDATTPNTNTAEYQIRRMAAVYKPRMPLTIDGAPAIEIGGEYGIRANAGDGWTLSGHPDLIGADAAVDDTKSGVVLRPHQPQLGGYSLLLRSNNLVRPTRIGLTFIQRIAKTKPQKPPVIVEYSIPEAERYAMGVIKRIKSDMATYKETGDLEQSFLVNPCSMMCSPKFCPAHGTDFCPITK